MKSISSFQKSVLTKFLVFLIITIIVAIYFFSERSPFIYQGYDKNVNLLQRYNAELNEAIVKTRFGILENYDAIDSAQLSLLSVMNDFNTVIKISPNDKLKNKLLSLELSVDKKSEITSYFKRINPILLNAINQFSRILVGLIGQETIPLNVSGSDNQTIRSQIVKNTNTLLQKMLIYVNLPSTEEHNELVSLVNDIQGLVNQVDITTINNAAQTVKDNFEMLKLSLTYANKILELQPQASKIDEQLFEVPIISNLNELNNAFSSLAESHLNKSATYRIILYLLVFILLVVLRWSFSRLQRILMTLNIEIERKNRAEEELEEINRQLEQRVSDRTRELSEKNDDLNKVLAHLKDTQDQLIIQEKMASVGMLTTGIAHEIKNPLNFVNNFSEISIDLLSELKNEILSPENKLSEDSGSTIDDILSTLKTNIAKIKEHGERADNIVKTMLLHSREAGIQKELFDLRMLLDDTLGIELESFKTANESFDVTIERQYDEKLENAFIAPQSIGRVLFYIIDNAFYAMREKMSKSTDPSYHPILLLTVSQQNSNIIIKIKDNGTGIPKRVLDKVFQPFYTTKPTGKGNTGLGLSICYDTIVKQHKGQLKVESEEGSFAEFIITLPISHKDETNGEN